MAKRPAGSYVQNVFNPFGMDEGYPAGFVNVVYSRNGEVLGYMSDGQFVELGETPPPATETNYQELSPEEQLALSSSRARVAKENMNVAPVGSDRYNEAKRVYDEATSEVKRLKPIVTENKKKQQASVAAEKGKTKLETLERKLKRAKDAGLDTESLEKEITKIKGEVAQAESTLKTPSKKAPEAKAPVTQTAETARQGDVARQPASKIAKTPTTKKPAKTPAKGPGAPPPSAPPSATKPATEADISKILSEPEFQIIDAVVDVTPEIRDIVTARANGEITDDEMRRRLRSSRFIATNGPTIRQRITEKAIYDKLTPEERAAGTSLFATEINRVKESVKEKAIERGAAISDTDAAMIAEKLYMTGQDGIDTVVTKSIVPYIKVGIGPGGGATVGGAAGANYQALLKTGFDNGLSQKELPAVLGYNTMDEALQSLATGESIATLQSRIRNYAMTGQSDFVKNQLTQGVNLRTIAAPYITAMATTLELNPQDIKLNDPSLMMALKDNGMNIYDYKRALKKDNRWQYTESAAEDVANKTLRILRDFGLEA